MDKTAGQFTTIKLQSLLDANVNTAIGSRRDLAQALEKHGQSISIHGIEAWFRHVDSNYNLERDSLSESSPSYLLPKRRWVALLDLFGLSMDDLAASDAVFRIHCFDKIERQDSLTLESLLGKLPQKALIGRELVRMKVLKAYAHAVNREPRFVFLEAEPGVGKSVLLEALRDDIALTDCLVLSSGCIEDSDVPLLPLLDLFEMQEDQIKRIDAGVAEQYLSLRRQVADFSKHPQGQVFLAITSLLLELAGQCTVVLIIDDLHWADDSTCRFLEHLTSSMKTSRKLSFLLLGASRPCSAGIRWEAVASRLASNVYVSQIPLLPLDQKETRALVNATIGSQTEATLSEWIWSLTLGNPLYVKHVVEHLKNTNQIDSAGHVKVQSLDAPNDINTTYILRYEALSEPTQLLLSFASALSNQFDLAELQYVFGKYSTDVVLDCLEEAEHTGLLIYANDRFRYSHPIARHSIYGMLSESRKALIHKTIGERLQLHSNASNPYVFIEVAEHLLKGRACVDGPSLIKTCVRAARISTQLDAWDKVIEFAQAAIELDAGGVLSSSERSELLALVGGGFHQTGDANAAISHLSKAVEGFNSSGNELEAARALTDIFRIQTNFGNITVADHQKVETLEACLPMLERKDIRQAAWTMEAIAARYLYSNHIEQAIWFSDRAVTCIEHLVPCREQALVTISAGMLDLNQSRPMKAVLHFSKAVGIAQSLKDDASIVRSKQRLAMAELALGRCQEARATLDTLSSYQGKVSETGEGSLVLTTFVSVCSLTGEFESTESTYHEALKLIENTGYSWASPNLIGAYTSCLVEQRRFDEAKKLVINLARDKSSSLFLFCQRLELLISDREAISVNDNDNEIETRLKLNPRKDGTDFSLLPTYAIGLEIALYRNDMDQIKACVYVVREAYDRGALFTGGWPFCIPFLLARAAISMGKQDIARDYLAVAIDVADRAGARGVLVAAIGVCEKHFPGIEHFQNRIQQCLARYN